MSDEINYSLVFPGLGVEACGHEAAFYARHESIIRPYIDAASERVKRDIRLTIMNDGFGALKSPELELATYAFSVGAAQVAIDRHGFPATGAGFSFGVYALLVASGVTGFECGFSIIEKARELVYESGSSGVLAAIVGLTESDILSLLENPQHNEIALVNRNNPICFVVGGPEDQINSFIAAALARDASTAQKIPVEKPYHLEKVLGKVIDPLRSFLSGLDFKPPLFPVVSTLDGALLSHSVSIMDYVARNVAQPIDWHSACLVLHAMNNGTLVEAGPGISLSQNGRFIEPPARYMNVKNGRSSGF